MEMKKKGVSVYALLMMLCTIFFFTTTQAATKKINYDQMDIEELDQKVKALKIGFEEYRLSHILTDSQKALAKKNPIKDSFNGTYKFHDQDINVVADKKTHKILAIYIERQEADKQKFRMMMSSLMMEFGEPTTSAHDTLIYWAFNSAGLIKEELYKTMIKESNLDILATAKFSSKVRIEKIMNEKQATKDEDTKKVTKETEEEINSIYCIVSSPPILKRFIATNRSVSKENKTIKK